MLSPDGDVVRYDNGSEWDHLERDAFHHKYPDPSGRRKSTTRTRDKNRSRPTLSCGECRRLKLKCDRVFPCQSCCKRGVAEICPEGSLTSGKGSRFILANTEQLHAKIVQLCDRVRQLEDALREVHCEETGSAHPLLTSELLAVKSIQDLYKLSQAENFAYDSSTAFEALKPGGETQVKQSLLREETRHIPDSGLSLGFSSESKERALPVEAPLSEKDIGQSSIHQREENPTLESRRPRSIYKVPTDILELSTKFPIPWAVDIELRRRIRDNLPPIEEARCLCGEAQKNALWQYNLSPSEAFIPNLILSCYSTPIEQLSPRRLSLLLIILSVGSSVDLRQPSNSTQAEAYHHLARASLCEIPLMEEPDFDALHSLTFMIWWHLIFSANRKAIGHAWNLIGFATKIAQGLGLHRNQSLLRLTSDEQARRQAVFWELLNLDFRLSLSLGRPPSFHMNYVDVKVPSGSGGCPHLNREENLYHEWKYSFFTRCLEPALQMTVSVKRIDYTSILELDGGIRDFNTPSLLSYNAGSAKPHFIVMQRALVDCVTNLVLLQLHRRHFGEAIASGQRFNAGQKYAPSVFATYLSASSLIYSVEMLFSQQQHISVRFLCFWFNAFSCTMVLSLIVCWAPAELFSHRAMEAIDRCQLLFEKAAKVLPFAHQTLPRLNEFANRARRCYMTWQTTGLPHNARIEKLQRNRDRLLLPPSFITAHASLRAIYEELGVMPPSTASIFGDADSFTQRIPREATPEVEDEAAQILWMGDVYGFNISRVADEHESSPSRLSDVQFHFDSRTLIRELEETYYMLWI